MSDDELAAFVRALEGVPGSAPWNLAGASEADRRRLLAELGRWVAWLDGRYGLSEQLPDCWARHGAMVEELLALHVTWNDAYRRADAPATAPLGWHDAFARSRERLREWNRTGCVADLHHDEPPPARPSPTTPA
jgi:hypothetical protein